MLLLLAACGPERSASSQTSTTQTTREIATTYQRTQDLATARTQLQQLEVANVNQWLLLTTEEAINHDGTSAETEALVKLAVDLGLQSNAIAVYARQHNLLAVSPAATVNATTPLAGSDTASNPEANTIANSVGNIIIPLPTKASDASDGTNAPVLPELAQEELGGESAAVDSNNVDANNDAIGSDNEGVGENDVEAAPVEESTATPEPTATPDTQPVVRVSSGINVRSGPGIDYPIAGALNSGESAQIVSKNPTGDWWEVTLASGGNGWVYGPLVETAGDTGGIAVAVNIPTPPPTPVPAPTEAPVEAAPVEAAPVEEAAPAPASGGPDFRVVEKRLWDVVENGGRLDGPSVTCGEKRQLVARVLDANGNLLNGVAVQAIYGAQEIFVTGSQGKGDGTVEFVLGGGQALKVIRDADGREVSSEEVYNLSTKPWEIPFETLIGGHFCTDEASCQSFVDATGCYGHYSWTVTFQRNY
ncbi:MAG: SH3 domain-containing protein [Caldilineaceae bacterium]|nr:SH3 domain-containing protein [Caldilineaceae bacterium]